MRENILTKRTLSRIDRENQILEALSERPMSPRELGDRFGISPDRLYQILKPYLQDGIVVGAGGKKNYRYRLGEV